MTDKIILIADYGRSGQGWLSYMLCYILNARYIEPYDFLVGRRYTASQHVWSLSQGNLSKAKTMYGLVVKTHSYPSVEFNLTDKVIFLTRDPRDVAVSAYFMFMRMKDQDTRGNIVRSIKVSLHSNKLFNFLLTAYKWRKHYRAWTDKECCRVRYEELSMMPQETIQGILQYLDVAVDDMSISEAVDMFSFEKITGRKKGIEDNGTAEFRKGIIGDYRNHFSFLTNSIFNLICGREAREAGYDLSSY